MKTNSKVLVSDIMVRGVEALTNTQSVHDARKLMAARQYRNVPVTSDTGQFLGVVTQMDVLREALRVNSAYGASALDARLSEISIDEILNRQCHTFVGDTPLIEAGRVLLTTWVVSVPVVENDRLIGMLSVSDYVRLAIDLLESA